MATLVVLQTKFVLAAPSSHRLEPPVGSRPTFPLTADAFEYVTNFAAEFWRRVREYTRKRSRFLIHLILGEELSSNPEKASFRIG